MNLAQITATEWERVKDLQSLFKYYGSQRVYQLWYNRFIRFGHIQPKKTRRKHKSKEDKI